MKRQKRLYLMQKHHWYPKARVYPKAKMDKLFGKFFWTSTVAYMLALAITEFRKSADRENVLGLWGVNMSHETEYGHQRLGAQHFIQILMDEGVNIALPFESDLLEPIAPYAYKEASRMWRALDAVRRQQTERLNEINRVTRELNEEKLATLGSLQQLDYVDVTFVREQQ